MRRSCWSVIRDGVARIQLIEAEFTIGERAKHRLVQLFSGVGSMATDKLASASWESSVSGTTMTF